MTPSVASTTRQSPVRLEFLKSVVRDGLRGRQPERITGEDGQVRSLVYVPVIHSESELGSFAPDVRRQGDPHEPQLPLFRSSPPERAGCC